MILEQQIISYLKSSISNLADISVDTELIKSSISDSFGIIDLINYIESEFGISIPDDEFDINNFTNVHSIVNMIRKVMEQ